MLQKIRDAFSRFMYGRYGTDGLNKALLIAALALLVLGSLGGKFLYPKLSLLNLLAYVPLIWCMIRMYSRNIEARRKENAAYQRLLLRFRDRDNRYFRCPSCRQTVRVPKGKGKINIRCPKCGQQFQKTT